MSGNVTWIESSKQFDGQFDCTDYSDECRGANDPDELHTDIIGHFLIKAYLVTVGTLAMVANVWVLVFSLGQIRRMTSQHQLPVSVCNRFFVLHIAVADLLMAVSLLVIGFTALRYQGHYCMYSMEWRTSNVSYFY